MEISPTEIAIPRVRPHLTSPASRKLTPPHLPPPSSPVAFLIWWALCVPSNTDLRFFFRCQHGCAWACNKTPRLRHDVDRNATRPGGSEGGMHQPRRWRIGNRGRTYPVHPPLLSFLYDAHLLLLFLLFLVSYPDTREADDKEGC